MVYAGKVTGRASSVFTGLVWATLTASVITLIGIAVTSLMIERELMEWKRTGYAVLIILLISSWAGAVVAALKIKRRKLLFCLMSGVLYFVMLLVVTALFFGGEYSGVGETALLILCGSLLASMWTGRGNKQIKHTKISHNNR